VKTALTEMRAQYDRGADPALIVRDLLEIGHEAARVQALGADVGGSGEDWAKKIRALADSQTPAQLSRQWQMLLKALEDVAKAPESIAAAEMAVVRLCAAANCHRRKMQRACCAAARRQNKRPRRKPAGRRNSKTSSRCSISIALLACRATSSVTCRSWSSRRAASCSRPAMARPPIWRRSLAARSRIDRRKLDVRSEKGQGVESLAAARAREQAAALAELKRHPFIADALAASPARKSSTCATRRRKSPAKWST